MALTKRMRKIASAFNRHKMYDSLAAFNLLKQVSTVKFVESVDVAIKLGIDPRKSDQVVRGATVLPRGIGKKIKVAVFAQGAKVEVAKSAGADIVGCDELALNIKAGKLDFDVLIATPDTMRIVAQLGPILGPRGLMPNPKIGTVTNDVAVAIANAKSGQVRYRTDKGGIIHCKLGSTDFLPKDLQENLKALLADIKKARPSLAKGIFLRKMTLSTTMGPGVPVDITTMAT